MGCIVESQYYESSFNPDLIALKQRHFGDFLNQGQPVILHRSDIINKRGPFKILNDSDREQAFNDDLLLFLKYHKYTLIAVVIDKSNHASRYGQAAFHPYHYCLTVMLERYCSFLRYYGGHGDVVVETRGKVEDQQLRAVYKYFYTVGTRYISRGSVQAVLTSNSIKLQPKTAQIAGLEIADILAHPCRQGILREKNIVGALGPGFGLQVWQCVKSKFNRRQGDGRVLGYGHVFLG